MTKYIWHTQEDDKVRPWHASRDGKVFDSNKPPKGGNPGDAPNCRCWAEPIEEEKEHKESGTKKLPPIVPDTPAECAQKDDIAIEKALDILIKVGVEGQVNYIYYDTKGIPTIGDGENINDKKTFMDINILHKGNDIALTLEEKAELYNVVQAHKPKLKKGEKYDIKAQSQPLFQNYIISETEQDRLAKEHLKHDLVKVKEEYAKHGINYAEVPPSAIAGSLEICYNRGRKGFEEFNKFIDLGIKQRDYDTAYEQSHREGMSTNRYNAIRKFYEDAKREMIYKENYGVWQ